MSFCSIPLVSIRDTGDHIGSVYLPAITLLQGGGSTYKFPSLFFSSKAILLAQV